MSDPAPFFRLATPADGPALAAIYDPVVRDTCFTFEEVPPGPAEMALRVAGIVPQLPWLVLVEADQVLGYAYAHPYRVRPAYRWTVETSIYVAEAARGRGVGRALYAALLNLLAAQGYRTVWAGAIAGNVASVRLHEGMGFRTTGRFPRAGFKHGTWHDLVLWHLPLAEDDGAPADPLAAGELVGTPAWEAACAAGVRNLRAASVGT